MLLPISTMHSHAMLVNERIYWRRIRWQQNTLDGLVMFHFHFNYTIDMFDTNFFVSIWQALIVLFVLHADSRSHNHDHPVVVVDASDWDTTQVEYSPLQKGCCVHVQEVNASLVIDSSWDWFGAVIVVGMSGNGNYRAVVRRRRQTGEIERKKKKLTGKIKS